MSESKIRLEAKKSAFEKNPERFIDSKDLVLGVINQKDGEGKEAFGFWIHDRFPDMLLQALYYKLGRSLNRGLDMREMMMEAEAAKKDKKIITPNEK